MACVLKLELRSPNPRSCPARPGVRQMNSILPFGEIERRFDKPVQLEQLGIDRIDDIAARDPNGILNTGFTVWHRHVQKNRTTNPEAVRDYLQTHGGTFIDGANADSRLPIIRDISFCAVRIDDPALDDHLVAYMLIALVYPNDMHFADLNLVNPYKPIPAKRREYKFRKYKGLGLLKTVLERAEAYALAQGCEYLTLTAATDDLVPLFTKFGYTVEDNQVATLAMEKKLSG